jgi:MerR family transcriptional regulator, light-induced transcriptional regulator
MGSATGLTIGDLAAGSGVNEATLRMWESRHGFPVPRRLESGHRRYGERDLEAVRSVVRARAEGLSLTGAIERARRLAAEQAPSVYAALRERFPELDPCLLGKRALLRLSRALEDECALRARRPVVFGSFQQERFYRQSEQRWRELTRTAELAIVFADFERARRPRHAPAEVPLKRSAELRREWVIVFDAPNVAACLAAWERPAGAARGRLFETVWTVERDIARHAARVCADLAAQANPALVEGVRERLGDEPAPVAEDVRTAVAVASRVVVYAAAALERR